MRFRVLLLSVTIFNWIQRNRVRRVTVGERPKSLVGRGRFRYTRRESMAKATLLREPRSMAARIKPSQANRNHRMDDRRNGSGTYASTTASSLPQCKVKRNYACTKCNYYTQNPRFFLFHQKNVHAEKIRVYECSQCLYASKHSQKLQRHIQMVHVAGKGKAAAAAAATAYKLKVQRVEKVDARAPMGNAVPSAAKRSKMSASAVPVQTRSERDDDDDDEREQDHRREPSTTDDRTVYVRCSVCPFGSHSQILVNRHEKVAHLKKKFFRCMKCNYVTHMKARYTKHVKYHTMPMIKCDDCDFRTPYKWNLDRHNRNHTANGAYKCSSCSFSADIKQSLTVHEMNHHVPPIGNVLPAAKRRYRVGASDAPGSAVDGTEIVTYETTKDGVVEIMTETKSTPNSCSKVNPVKSIVKKSVVNTAGNISVNLFACSLCDYTSPYEYELKAHGERMHSNVSSAVPKKKSAPRPLPKLIPITDRQQQQQQHLRNTAADRPPSPAFKMVSTTAPVSEEDFNRLKAARSSLLGDFVSLIDDEGFATPARKTALHDGDNAADPRCRSESGSPGSKSTASSSSSSAKRPSGSSFFDKLKAKVDETSNLVCPVCRHESKCLSEYMCHQRTHNDDDDDDDETRPGEKAPFVSSLELKSTRCQHCRKRCKTSAELRVHLLSTCEAAAAAIRAGVKRENAAVLAAESSAALIKDECHEDSGNGDTKSSMAAAGDLGGTNSENGIHQHPMENKIFVWNTVAPPPEKEEDYDQEDNEGDGVDMAETTKCRRLSVDSAVEDQSDLNVPGGGPEFYSSLVLQPHQQFHRRDRKMYKTVFKCPHCTFWASTASRFHVHIVGHLNKKPFECSFCAYRSNWRWDITKHIRLKSVRDDSHQGAKVLMTDETGRRNYTKYNKYLTVMEVDDKTDCDGGARGVGSSSGKVQSQQQQQQQQQRASGRKRTQKTHGQLTVVLATTAAGKPATSGRVQASTDGPTHPKVAALSVRALAAAAALKAESEKNQTLTVGKKLKVGTADKTMRSPLAPNSTENKKTVWKCKKCFFRDCDRITVLNHVKAHYRRGEFNGQSEQRSNNVDVNNCGADQNRREPISIKIKTKPFRTTDNIVDQNVKHCTMCDETVKNVTELKAHMLTHQIPEETKYRCEYCPFWCEKKKAMLDHMKYAHEMDNGNNGGCGVGEQNDSLAVTSVRSSEETLMDDFERGFDDTEVKDEPMDEDEQDDREDNDEERKEIEVANSNWAAATTTIPLPPIYDSGVKPRIPLTAEKRRSIFLDDGQFDDDDDDEHTEIPHGLGLKASADRCIPCNVCWYYSTSKSDMAAHKQLHVRRGALYNCDRCVYNVTKLSLLYEHYRCAHMVEEPQKLYPEEAVIRTSRNEMFAKNGEVGGGENGDDGVDVDDTPPLLWSYKDGTFGKVYKCRYCPHTNQRRHNTMEHEKMHSDHPQQQQPKQEATQADGDSSNALHSSSNTSVLENSPMHPCKRCTYMCNNAGVLSSHLKVHSEDYGVAVGFVDTTVRDLVQTKALEYVIELESRLDTVCSTTNDDGDDTIEGETKKSSVDAGSESGTVKFCRRCPARFLNADDLSCHSRYHRYRWSWTCDQCSFSARTRQFVDQHKPVHGPEYESVTVRLLEKHGVSQRYPKPDEYDDKVDISAAAVVELKSPRSTIKMEEECVERGAVVGREEEKVQRNRENGGDEYAAAKTTSNRRESARRSVSSEDSANEKTTVTPISSVSKTLVTSSAKGYVKQFTCDRCPGRFFKTAALQYHLTLHGGPGKHKCRRCDYAVSTYGNLVRHESVHEDLPAREKTVRPKTVRAVATGVAAKSGYAALPPPPPTIPLSQDDGGMSPTGDSSRVTITTTTTTTDDDDDDDDEYLEDDDEIVGSPNTTGSYKTTKSANSANRSPEASSGSPDAEFGVQMLGHPNFYYPTTVKNGVAKQKRYKCAKCPSAFDKRDQYKVHLTLHGADDKYKCDKCDYSVKYTANYVQHQRKHALDAELRSAAVAAAKTTACNGLVDGGAAIENQVEIKEEMLEGDADKEGAATVVSGEDCGEEDSGKDGRSRSDREHTKCIETINSKRAADANRSLRRCCDGAATPVTPTVDRRQMFRNEISDEQTAYELNAAYAEVYKCAECPFECGGRTELDKHSVHHSSKRWKRLCPFCTYVTQTESDLSDHLRVHFARPSDTTADFVHRAENENGQIEYYGKRVYPAREGGGGDRKDDGRSEENGEEEPFFVFGDDRFDGSIRFQPQCEPICIDYNDNSTTMTGGPRGEETAAKPAFVKMLTAGRVELVDGGGKKKKKK
ncbi:uncharacterized protein LOC126899338 isoform X2 [Daktulosphaira vitifoliae]|uniref:uncharacterized protein LOC126899338 isoform X2 n=1 Tax=Daktulosphaira vitifoliae TaxID=58002 RepID=UPI0021AA8158|nr:uncharacterized protein LOC126899338 isoform X2 [Daktulosphaira vitifoliae]